LSGDPIGPDEKHVDIVKRGLPAHSGFGLVALVEGLIGYRLARSVLPEGHSLLRAWFC
jgi:hypothetical protein